MTKKELAEKIATEILTVYGYGNKPIICTRAQLMIEQPNGLEMSMGGRCKKSIVAVLEEYLPDQPEPVTGDFLLLKWNEILIEHDESISIPDLLDELAIEINKETIKSETKRADDDT